MLVGAATAYGLNAPFARLASFFGISGADLVVLRVAALLLCFVAVAALSRASLKIPAGERVPLLALGLATSMVGLAYLSAVTFIPVGIAVMLFYIYPLLILIASPFVDGSRLTLGRLFAFGLAFGGIVLAIGPSAQVLDWRGVALAAAASAAATVQFFLAARAPGGGGLATIFWIHVVILPAAIAASLATGGPAAPGAFAVAAWPVFLTSAGYIVGFALQMRGLRSTRAAVAGLIFCLEPIVATLTAAALLHEHLSLGQYGGGVLVLLGIVVSLTVTAEGRCAGTRRCAQPRNPALSGSLHAAGSPLQVRSARNDRDP